MLPTVFNLNEAHRLIAQISIHNRGIRSEKSAWNASVELRLPLRPHGRGGASLVLMCVPTLFDCVSDASIFRMQCWPQAPLAAYSPSSRLRWPVQSTYPSEPIFLQSSRYPNSMFGDQASPLLQILARSTLAYPTRSLDSLTLAILSIATTLFKNRHPSTLKTTLTFSRPHQ